MKNLWIILAAFLLAHASLASAAEPKQYGSITYPAAGNIDLDEGTFDIWVVCGYDTDAPNKQQHTMTIFDLKPIPEEPFHYYLGMVNGSLAQIGFVVPRQSYVWAGALHWKTGERHLVTWTWSGRKRSIFIDGKIRESGPNEQRLQGEGRGNSSADVVVEGWLRGNLSRAQLIIGLRQSFMTVQGVRISSTAHSSDEVARTFADAGKLTRDAHTLLLDHCDGEPAEVISGFSGERGAALSGSYKVIESTFGKALQLWVE